MERAIGMLFNKGLIIALFGFAGALTVLAAPASAAITPTSWELASEFSDVANPSGVWSYGSKPTLTGAYAVMTTPVFADSGNITGWSVPASVTHNVNPYPYTSPFGGGPVTFPPHALVQHPGIGCEYSVVRFTVPHKGKYRISGQFYAMDDNGSKTDTDVEILLNNVQVFGGQVKLGAGLNKASFTTISATLKTNDTIDFEVGCGSDGAYSYDTTGLNAVIERK